MKKSQTRYQIGGLGTGRWIVYDNGQAVASFSREMDARHWIDLEKQREVVGKELKQFIKDVEQGKVKSQDLPF